MASPPTILIARPGPGNGWRQTRRSGRPNSAPTALHLVLEQGPQGLDQLELHVVGQAAHVVVRLDRGGTGAAAGLDHVGVEGPLHQVARQGADFGDLGGLLLEDADELGADRLALGLGLGYAFELLQEALLGVDRHQRAP